MSERKPKETRTSGGRVTNALPGFTFLGRPQHALFPAGDIVYFMYSGGRIKIGYSAAVRTRHKRLRASGPFQPVVFLVMAGNAQNEQAIHAQFKAERLHGEWFTLSPRLRSYLRVRLCDLGRETLEMAEAEYKADCEAFLAAYVTPGPRRPRTLCQHQVPASTCPRCERERDLKVLEKIKNGTFRIEA